MDGGGGTGRRGLVIGAGAALGGAWAIGALGALAEVEGYDATAVDVVVGTSAGSLLAAMISLAVSPEDVALRLTGSPAPEAGEQVTPFDVRDHVHRALDGVPRPVPLPGNLRLAARTLGRPDRHTAMTAAAGLAPRGRGDLTPIGELVEECGGGLGWPRRPRTWVVALDFDSGRRVVFGRPGAPEATLPEAVMASCAVPGFFRPAAIGGRRYVDGGAVSVTNADVLVHEHLDEVLVLAPLVAYDPDHPRSAGGSLEKGLRRLLARRLDREISRLAATGTADRVLAPGPEDLAVMGTNLRDAGRRRAVLETSLHTTARRLTVLATRNGTAPDGLDRAG
jgi:NTE family protein